MEFKAKPNNKPKYHDILASVDPQLLQQWTEEQNQLKQKLIEKDCLGHQIKFVAGADITFSQNYPTIAICTIAILDKELNVQLLKSEACKITVPYVPGFLAFREAPCLAALFSKAVLKFSSESKGEKVDCVFVDGNGILHPRQCGLAAHLGALIGLPTIGCAKTIFAIDGINSHVVNEIKEKFKNDHEDQKDVRVALVGKSGKVWGMAVKNSENAFDPLIVSVGNMIEIERAVDLVMQFSQSRVVEPVRVSDKHSRFLVKEFEKFIQKNSGKGKNEDELIAEFQLLIDTKFDLKF